MDLSGFLKNFKIKTYYQYLLYLSAFTLIFSLLFELKGVENSKVTVYSMWVIGGSVLMWLFESGVEQLYHYLYEINLNKNMSSILKQDNMVGYYKQRFIYGIVSIIIHLVFWLILVFYILWKNKLC